MSAGALAWVLGFILDPRWGIPTLVLLEAAALWIAWNPRTDAPLGARRRSWTRPEGDPVSRMYYAVRDEQYSVLVRWSRERIEELYEARAGRPLPSLVAFRFRDAPAPGRPDPRALRRLTRELGGFEWEAREREIGLHLRWAFWRSRARDRERYRERVDALLRRSQEAIAGLEGSAS